MSYMADRDHIAITRGNKSTTTCKFFPTRHLGSRRILYWDAPLLR